MVLRVARGLEGWLGLGRVGSDLVPYPFIGRAVVHGQADGRELYAIKEEF